MGTIFIRSVRCGVGLAAIAAATALPCAAQRVGPTVTVAGRVVDSLTQPLAGADVGISALRLGTETDAYGRFRLPDVPAGVHFLSVRRLGYGPVDVAILTPRDSSLTPVILVPGAVVLRTIVTRTVGLLGKPSRLAYTSKFDGFYERRAYAIGVATFYTREDIGRMDVQYFTSILRGVGDLHI